MDATPMESNQGESTGATAQPLEASSGLGKSTCKSGLLPENYEMNDEDYEKMLRAIELYKQHRAIHPLPPLTK